MYMQKKKLENSCPLNRKTSSRFAKESFGERSCQSSYFCTPLFHGHISFQLRNGKSFFYHMIRDDVVCALKVGSLFIQMLCLLAGEKLSMGYINEAMNKAKETIEHAFGGVRRQYEKVLINARWTAQLHRPLHAASHILNRGCFILLGKITLKDLDLWMDYHRCVEKSSPV